MTLGMLTFAIRRVSEPHRRRRLAGCGPVIAHIRPQTPCAGLATARCQYRQRGVVRMHLVATHDIAMQRMYQWAQQLTAAGYPIGQRSARQRYTKPSRDRALAIQRLMVERDRTSVGVGKCGFVRVDFGCSHKNKKKK